jgi:hypothetical protein
VIMHNPDFAAKNGAIDDAISWLGASIRMPATQD